MSSARREFGAAVAACVVVSLLLLIVCGRPWAHAVTPGLTQSLSGRRLTEVPAALSWVGLAGGLALLATAGWWRRGIGLLIAVAGVVAAVACADHAGGGTTMRLVAADATAWPWVGFAASVLMAAAGGWVVVRAMRWPALGGRYDAPGAPRRRRVDPTVAAWEALDRGEDPTA